MKALICYKRKSYMKKKLVCISLVIFCINCYSMEITSEVKVTDITIPSVLITDDKPFSDSCLDVATGNLYVKKDVLVLVSTSPGNAPYLKQRRTYEIVGNSLLISSMITFLTSTFISAPNSSEQIVFINRNLLYASMALGFSGYGVLLLEKDAYHRAISNYNLWIMGIPFKVGS